jgi:transglutaminase-like putative cysteine protease
MPEPFLSDPDDFTLASLTPDLRRLYADLEADGAVWRTEAPEPTAVYRRLHELGRAPAPHQATPSVAENHETPKRTSPMRFLPTPPHAGRQRSHVASGLAGALALVVVVALFALMFDRFGVNGSAGPGGDSSQGGLFSDSLRLVGTVNLSEVPVLHYVPGSAADGSEYLIAETFDQYDGTSQWTSSPGQLDEFGADAVIPAGGSVTRTVTYTITYDAIGGSGQKLLLAPGAEASLFSVPSVVTVGKAGGQTTAWRSQSARPNGQSYLAKGYVTQGTVQQLRAVQWPRDATGTGPLQFTPGIISQYVQPGSPVIAFEVKKAAQEATKGASNMYDAATALADYLRTFKYSTKNDDPPAGQDAMVWFLQHQVGFCTFFASAMTLMARSLGMPARIAVGFTSGGYDAKTGTYIVKESASHAWTQIYFAQYGWVNFEPTPSFSLFLRPVASQSATLTPDSRAVGSGSPADAGHLPRSSDR